MRVLKTFGLWYLKLLVKRSSCTSQLLHLVHTHQQINLGSALLAPLLNIFVQSPSRIKKPVFMAQHFSRISFGRTTFAIKIQEQTIVISTQILVIGNAVFQRQKCIGNHEQLSLVTHCTQRPHNTNFPCITASIVT